MKKQKPKTYIKKSNLPGFGSRLATHRKARDLSQVELAELLQVSQQQIGHLELDKVSPTFKIAIDLARVLGCSVVDLVPE